MNLYTVSIKLKKQILPNKASCFVGKFGGDGREGFVVEKFKGKQGNHSYFLKGIFFKEW